MEFFSRLSSPALLSVAWQGLRRDAAPGGDGVGWYEWEKRPERHLIPLAEKLRTLRWRPDPRMRRELPKQDGGMRAVYVSTLRDKVVEAAWKLLLTEAFSFKKPCDLGMGPFSHGATLPQWFGCETARYVLRADVAACFDEIPLAPLLRVVGRRVHEGRALILLHRLLGPHERGVPQGLVCAPVLANLYLSRALDHWPSLPRHFARYADDFVAGYSSLASAAGAALEFSERLAAWGLRLNASKTAAVDTAHEPVSFLGLTREPGGRVVPDREAPWPEDEEAREGCWSHYRPRCSRSALRGLAGGRA